MMVFESDSELGELFRVLKSHLGVSVTCRSGGTNDYILAARTHDGQSMLPWYGNQSCAECANRMVKTFQRNGIPLADGKRAFLPEFDSMNELKMKLDLMGK